MDLDLDAPCILWDGAISKQTGYGYFYLPGSIFVLAHRAAYEAAKGPIPEGLTVDHVCTVLVCVQPLHLEAVTRAENTRRELERRARITHCRRGGHPLHGPEADVYMQPTTGKIHCNICRRERVAA